MGGTWYYWCSTIAINKNDQLFQHKMGIQQKNKRKIWKQKTCRHKFTYLPTFGWKLKMYLLPTFGWKVVSWDGWNTIVGHNEGQLCLHWGGNSRFWLFFLTQENIHQTPQLLKLLVFKKSFFFFLVLLQFLTLLWKSSKVASWIQWKIFV